MNDVHRRQFLQFTFTTFGTTLVAGCGRSDNPQDIPVAGVPVVKHERAEQLFELYGVRFPDDLFQFWEWYNELPTEASDIFHEELGIRLVGPFDVLAGRFDNVELRYPAVLHWRYQFDPPEFFTVFTGNTDRLHWGYFFDDPPRLPPVVSAYYASDAFELWTDGNTLFDAVSSWIAQIKEGLRENIEYDPDYAEVYRKSLTAISKLEQVLPVTTTSGSRKPTHSTPERMGVVLPEDAGEAGELLLRGKQLWFDGDPTRFQVLAQAYDELGRTALAAVTRTHQNYPRLPRIDILEYRSGDYHSLEAALAEPEKVVRLELGNAKLESLPDLSSLSNLEELSLWGNLLSDLPSSLAGCEKLKGINLFRNLISSIPSVLYELPNLEKLQLGQNKISDVEGIEQLRNLKELILIGNPVPESKHDMIRTALPNTIISF